MITHSQGRKMCNFLLVGTLYNLPPMRILHQLKIKIFVNQCYYLHSETEYRCFVAENFHSIDYQ